MQRHGLHCPSEYLRFHPLLLNRRAETKNMAQMKEQINAPEKITKRQRDSQPIRYRVQNTGNQDAHRNG